MTNDVSVPLGFTRAMAAIMREERADIDKAVAALLEQHRDELRSELMAEMVRLVADEVRKQARPTPAPRKSPKLKAVG